MVDFFNGREEFYNNSFIKIKNLKSTIFRQHAVSVFDDIFFESDKYRIRTNPNNKSDDETNRLVSYGLESSPTHYHVSHHLAHHIDHIDHQASSRLGGRVESWPLGEGSQVELGAQWIHGRGECPLWRLEMLEERRGR